MCYDECEMNEMLLKKIYRNSWSFDFEKFLKFFERMRDIYNLNSIQNITLCGSNRFKFQIDLIEKSLVILGFTVFNFPNFHSEYLSLNDLDKKKLEIILDVNHMTKIYLSDLIIIVNIDNYIGKSVNSEIKYCKKIRKQYIYYEV